MKSIPDAHKCEKNKQIFKFDDTEYFHLNDAVLELEDAERSKATAKTIRRREHNNVCSGVCS
jgi:hypothetical protein